MLTVCFESSGLNVRAFSLDLKSQQTQKPPPALPPHCHCESCEQIKSVQACQDKFGKKKTKQNIARKWSSGKK